MAEKAPPPINPNTLNESEREKLAWLRSFARRKCPSWACGRTVTVRWPGGISFYFEYAAIPPDDLNFKTQVSVGRLPLDTDKDICELVIKRRRAALTARLCRVFDDPLFDHADKVWETEEQRWFYELGVPAVDGDDHFEDDDDV